MNFKKLLGAGLVAGAFAISSMGAAGAAIDVNLDTGVGFVGKGDVQYTFSWSNKQLQDNLGGVAFTYDSTETTVTEVSWVCTNDKDNTKTQERERTTTTTSSTTGIIAALARDGKKQITGVNLKGFSSKTSSGGTPTTDGPQLNSCPSSSTLTTPAGEPELDEEASTSTGGLYVSHSSYNNGLAVPLLEKPTV
jgi:hypothetical protein